MSYSSAFYLFRRGNQSVRLRFEEMLNHFVNHVFQSLVRFATISRKLRIELEFRLSSRAAEGENGAVFKEKGKNRKILAFTDSSSDLGWLYKASFSNSQVTHAKYARCFARMIMRKDSALYSQHICGVHDVITDSLLQDHHTSDNQLTFMLKNLFPTQA